LSFYMDKHVECGACFQYDLGWIGHHAPWIDGCARTAKDDAEYIQATSRVGRDDEKPGLVVTLFNIHRPRDRSHYERFETYHSTFYRAVEATSVTPFSPRAIDRASLRWWCLSPDKIGARSHLRSMLLGSRLQRTNLNFVSETLASRVESFDPKLSIEDRTALRQKLEAEHRTCSMNGARLRRRSAIAVRPSVQRN